MPSIVSQKRKFRNIDAIIFDKDGTLADSHQFLASLGEKRLEYLAGYIPQISEKLRAAFGVYQGKLNPVGLMAVGSRQENLIVAAGYLAAGNENWLEAMAIAETAFVQADQAIPESDKIPPAFPGCLETMRKLAAGGVKLGILSADTTAGVQMFVAKYDLCDCIELCMGTDSDLSKPDPRFFVQACTSLGVSPSATMMVGDAPGDIVMAKQAQAAATIGIAWELDQKKYLQEADMIIHQLTDLEIIS